MSAQAEVRDRRFVAGSQGTFLVDRLTIIPPLTPQAADLFVPDRRLVVPERRLHLVTADQVIAFDKSSEVSPEVREVLDDPELITAVFPMAAKNWWRFTHSVGVAEIFVRAHKSGILEREGFDFPPDRARQFIRAGIAHDLGMAFTKRNNRELNPEEKVNYRENTVVWRDMKRHPVLTDRILGRDFSGFELDLMGEHQKRGKVRDRYGRNPYKEVTDPSEHADDREHLLFTILDILQASTDTGRKYHTPTSASGALKIVRNEFNGSRLGIEGFLAQLAYKRRGFRLVATLDMEAFNNSLRGEDGLGWSGENERYWSNPHALAGVFAHRMRTR